MSWPWVAKRAGISAFLLFHLGATTLWVLPQCPLRQRTVDTIGYYMWPLGLWQCWAMFAPDPVHDPVTLEAEIVDSKGMRHVFTFPRMADYTTWQGIPRFRYSKYTANLSADFDAPRKFAARHAVRQSNLPADAFPVEAYLMFRLRPTPPPGSPPPDPMTPTQPRAIANYQFASRSEVLP